MNKKYICEDCDINYDKCPNDNVCLDCGGDIKEYVDLNEAQKEVFKILEEWQCRDKLTLTTINTLKLRLEKVFK